MQTAQQYVYKDHPSARDYTQHALTADKLGGREMQITPIYCDASEVVNISSFNCATIGRNYIQHQKDQDSFLLACKSV